MFFDGVLARKEGFLAYKNVTLTKLKNLRFLHVNLVTNLKFLLGLFFFD